MGGRKEVVAVLGVVAANATIAWASNIALKYLDGEFVLVALLVQTLAIVGVFGSEMI